MAQQAAGGEPSGDDPFDEPLAQLRATRSSYKWRAHSAAVLPAFVAEMDVRLASDVRNVLREAIDHGDTGYASRATELGDALAGFAQRRFGVRINPGDVHPIPDVMAGILETLRHVTQRGDGVIVTPPVYAPFFLHIAEAGCLPVEAPLAPSGDSYSLDLDALQAAFSAGARVLLLCNPHNPTGRVFTASELRAAVDLAAAHDAWILSDEIHAPLVLPGSHHVPLLSIDSAAERAFVFMSASKEWNIPGLKCAQLVTASPRTRAVVRSFPEAVTFRTGHLGILATVAAYRGGESWLDSLVAAIARKQTLFSALLEEQIPAVRPTPAQATYLAWLDCRQLGLGDDTATVFLERGRVALDAGPKYGRGGAGHVRATIATSDANLREMVQRMARALPC